MTIQKLERRKSYHLYFLNKDYKLHFYNALRKHGRENFSWKIIKELESKEELILAERYYIKEYDSYKNGYNQTEGGDGLSGFKHTEESKRKISERNKGKLKGENNPMWKIGENHPLYGKKHTPKTRKKIFVEKDTKRKERQKQIVVAKDSFSSGFAS